MTSPSPVPDAQDEHQRIARLLRQMQAKLDAAQGRAHEPVAVVGLACRLPGGTDDAASLWSLLEGGVDAVTEVPPERWDVDAWYDPDPDAVGKIATRSGAFLREVDHFDAGLFGVSAREATSMDPQQRLVLEVAWRALEDAGLAPRRLAGSRTGVFLGMSTCDYARISDGLGDVGLLDTYSGTGGANSMAAGRLSYTLGLRGPSLVVDTACSSSLVAVHLAVQSLRSGESDVALAGGVNLVLLPEGTVALSRLHMMAPDGRCKAFDARADGFVRGEGCGIVVLKRLSDARAAGDRVLAVLRGTAVNQDGRSAGLTAPSGSAQQAVIREALAAAGVSPAEVAYVEAHGTGTALGDPIELNALCEALGPGRAGPLLVGSIKSNLGHLESAAGIAGLIKAIECVRRGRIPPSLHFRSLNPHVDTRGVELQIPTIPQPWPAGQPRIAGVSSFGFSGTNAHVVLQAWDEPQQSAVAPLPAPRPVEVLPVSARTPQALARMVEELAQPGVLEPWADACHMLGARREVFEYRLAVVAGDAAQARQRLAGARPVHVAHPPRIAFVYTGQGAQAAGMGHALYAQEPVFRRAIDRCAQAVRDQLAMPLQDLMFTDIADLSRTEHAQPALLAWAIAMTELLGSWGVQPEAVMGHSLGEYAAAVAAGVVGADDAMRLVAERGRLMQAQPGGSGMAAVLASVSEVQPWLTGEPQVVVASENGPRAVTLAGELQALGRVCDRLAQAGLMSRPLAVSHAFHSPWMDPVLAPLEAACARIDWRPPALHLVGNVNGAPLSAVDAAYWRTHTRSPVAFHRGLQTLRALGCNTVVEIGPQPALQSAGNASLPGTPWIAAARHGHEAATQEALAALHTAGALIDWAAVHAGRGRRPVPLPGHPFERRAYWRGQQPGRGLAEVAAARAPQRLVLARWPDPALDWLQDHLVHGAVVVPAALLLVLAVEKVRALRGPGRLADLQLTQPLHPDEGCELVLVLQGDEIRLDSRFADGPWLTHASGRWQPHVQTPQEPATAPTPESIDPATLHAWMADGGIVLGPSFRRLVQAWRGAGCAHVKIGPASVIDVLPSLVTALDAALQSVALPLLGTGDGRMRVPARIGRTWIADSTAHDQAGPLQARAQWRAGPDDGEVTVVLSTHEGRLLALLEGIGFAPATSATDVIDGWLVAREWLPLALPEPLPVLAETAAGAARTHPLLTPQAPAHQSAKAVGASMDAAALTYARRALAQVAAPGEEAVGHPLRVAPRHARLHALLQRRCAAPPLNAEPADPDAALLALAAAHPAHAAEIALLARCGAALPQVLGGMQDPLALLFDGEDAGAVYRDAPVSALLNDCVAQAVLQALPARGPFRVLEAGAGTGGTTARLLQTLPTDRLAEYVFTDVSSSLLAQARTRWSDVPALRVQPFDFDGDALSQGLSAGRYDVVVAANAVHAAQDLVHTLAQLRQLLAPGGTLVLLEGAGEQGWIDLVFGLTEGWWRFADTNRRPHYPLPIRDEWPDVLSAAGFEAMLTPALPAPLHRQLLLLGRAAAPASAWVVHGEGVRAVALATSLGAMLRPCADPLPDTSRAGCVLAMALDALAPADAAALMAQQQAWFEVVRRQALACAAQRLPLVLLSTGACTVAPWQASLWGLARGIAAELPELQLRWIDVDPELAPDVAAALLADELRCGASEDQVRLTAAGRFVPRLEPNDCMRPTGMVRHAVDPQRAYLVTGGFGGLGMATVGWLADQGARHLVLLGRSPASQAAAVVLQALRARGVAVHERVGDVADPSVLREAISAPGRPLAAAFHAAGTLADATLAALDWPRMEQVLRPKLLGGWWLDRLLPADAALVLYGSAVTLTGSAGQANHVAANACLDALAAARRAAGRPALSIAWGAWEQVGSATSQALAVRLRQAGLGTITPAAGLRALRACLNRVVDPAAPACIGVLPVDAPTFLQALPSPVPPVLRDWAAQLERRVRTTTGSTVHSPASATEAPQRLAPNGDLLAIVLQEASAVLAAEGPQALDPQRGLFEVGMDSLTALELRRRLQGRLGRPLPSTLLFDHPVPAALARFLQGEGELSAAPAPSPAAEEPIAVVGIGCRFPGSGNGPERFWEQLMAGHDAIGPWPAERDWIADPFPGQARAGGFLAQVDHFDAAFFHIAPREAQSMDPQQRLLLETAWHALQHAGIVPQALAGSATGVFVGACNYDYAQVAYADGRIDAWSGTGGAPSVIAGRIAYTLGLEGPALVVDTACSSSLVAVHLACRSLRDGECRTALAGGVNLILAPASTTALGALQMLSPDGACKAFDAGADGFVRGEGCALVVLKRLSDARADGDPVLAVIRGSATNQDGHSSSLTAPSARAQEAVIRAALARAGVSPAEVGYVEAHGTGTQMGDPIEVAALRDVFAPGRNPDQPLAVGALKSNLGHLEAAAGIAGLIKAVLAVYHGQLPPNLHLRRRNPHIEVGTLGLLLPQTPIDWPLDGPRIAGVSSFGFSGTNAHVVLAQPPDGHAARRAPLPLQQFRRERHWVTAGAPARSSQSLLGRRLQLPSPGQAWERIWHSDDPRWLADHRVGSAPVVPAAALLEVMAQADGGAEPVLADVDLTVLVRVEQPLRLHTQRADGWLRLHACTIQDEADGCGDTAWQLVASARQGATDAPLAATEAEWELAASRCTIPLEPASLYAHMEAGGQLEWGPALRAVRAVRLAPPGEQGWALLDLELPEPLQPPPQRLHPVLLDGVLQGIGAAGLALGGEQLPTAVLPRTVDLVQFGAPAGRTVTALVRLRRAGNGLLADLDVRGSGDGSVMLVMLRGLRLTPMAAGTQRPPALYRPVWQTLQPAQTFATDGWSLAHGDEATPTGRALLALLHTAGQAPQPPDRACTALFVADAGEPVRDVCLRLQDWVRTLLASPQQPKLRVVVETVANDLVQPAPGALAGFVQALRAEHPTLDARCLLLPASAPPQALQMLLCADAPLVAWHDGQTLARSWDMLPDSGPGPRFALRRPAQGRLEELVWAACDDDGGPGPGEVEIEVLAAGLNFRDVMNALHLYPGDAGALGGECAGIVRRIGPGVEHPAPGSLVLAVAGGCHASHVRTPALLAWPVPPGWKPEQAAAQPTVFLTAAWALRGVGAIGPGQRVLVHAGTGGLGMAAIQLAQRAGATVYATASTPAKRELLRKLGVAGVGDSRSPDFGAQVLQASGGAPMDIVLNSLSAELAEAGLRLLAPGGRFLEVGKAGIWTPAQAQALRPDVAYHRVALDDDIRERPAEVRRLWEQLRGEFARGDLVPLPVQTFPMAQAQTAYRHMQRALHTGRLVLTRRLLRGDAAYVVTGGTGAVGGHLAQWLAERGAGEVLVAGRTPPDAAFQTRLAAWSCAGAQVRHVQVDVGTAEGVAALLAAAQRPLAGVFHAAGVLDDASVLTATPAQWDRVLGAKLNGALQLDMQTRGLPLEHFVLMGSAAGALGSAGQCAYAAANAALAALARQRRRLDLPGIAIDWGAWQGGGMARGRSGPALAPPAALAVLEQMLLDPAAPEQLLVLPQPLPRADAIAAGAGAAAPAPDWPDALAAVTAHERPALARSLVRAQAATILSLAPVQVAIDQPLRDFGLDSLMAVELRNALAAAVGQPLPAGLLFDFPSVDALAEHLLAMLEAGPPTALSTPFPAAAPTPVGGADELTQALQNELRRAGY